jgi:hypothetical protein
MAGNKYLINNAGRFDEARASQASAGSGDAGKIVALNSAGQIDPTMVAGISGLPTVLITAQGAIAAGSLVNIFNVSGTLTAKVADSTTAGSEAQGYATAAISNGATGNVIVGEGLIAGLSGLTSGADYFLGAAGAPVTPAPSTAGNSVQRVGRATSTTSLYFQPSQVYTTVIA